MKIKIKIYLNKYWILILFLGLFAGFTLPLCFQNNDNINIVLAEHIDSGSILGSILQLFDRSKKNSFYNQNIPFHTLYGFPYNSIVFFIFGVVKKTFGISLTHHFFIFPLLAKLVNFFAGLLSIILLHKFTQKFLKHNLSKIICLTLTLIFPDFLHYVFHIKPDILGLLFSLISFNYLFDFLENKKNKNIIIANVFGGLSILCKQPHIFIVLPLFLGFIIGLKGNIKNKVKKILYIYLKSAALFLFIFFLIHPYAFIQPNAFIEKQKSLFSMTSTLPLENLNSWISMYTENLLLLTATFIPFAFLLLNVFKKFRNKNTKYLNLVLIYIIAYLLWLTFKVGPMRFFAYLIPVLPLSILLFSYIFDLIINNLIISKFKIIKIIYLIIIIAFILFSVKIVKENFILIKKNIDSAYKYKQSNTYKAATIFEKDNFKKNNLENKTIIYSASIPIDERLYKKADNTWQGLTKSNYLFIDFTVGWEKTYEYWKTIAKENGLNKEMFFIDNIDKEKNIVLFYK